MWLFTTLGFFSCTRSAQDEAEYQIRARLEGDIRGLCEALHIPARIIETPDADYRWRIIVDRETFGAIIAELAERVNYSNFKDAVHQMPGQESKGHPYLQVWSILRNLQEAEKLAQARAGSAGSDEPEPLSREAQQELAMDAMDSRPPLIERRRAPKKKRVRKAATKLF